MINGEIKTEAIYRSLGLDSSSSLKVFSEDRKKYQKIYILNEDVREKDDAAITTGKISELLLLEPERFDSVFSLSSCVNPPTEMMLKFVDALADLTIEATDDFGQLKRTFTEIAQDAYDRSGYKLKFEAILNKFNGSDAEIYYNELLDVRSKHLTVVTLNEVQNSERIVEELKSNPITANIVNLVSSVRYDVRKQFQIENYSIDGLAMKSMMDLVIFDRDERTIQVFDLKVTWSSENFVEGYYLYRRAYIQAFVYYKALLSLALNPESEYYGYIVLPPKFIVADSINYYSPLIYTLDEDDLNDAYYGFEHRGKKYPGVYDIITNLKWALDNNCWSISRENYLNNGVVKIKNRDDFNSKII